MTLNNVLNKLKELGSEKMRRQNLKRADTLNQYGVRMGDIRKLSKEIKNNLSLGLKLWDTKLLEAQLLTCLIIKPKQLSISQLDSMVRVTHFFQLADWFNAYLVAKHPQNEEIREKWMNDNNPAAARAGWNLCSIRVSQKAEYIDTAQILNRLENEMKKADQYVQWTMNFTLVNIGIYHQELRDKAIQVSEDLGVYKDFPVSKGCTSPYAPIWINEMVSRLKK